MREYKILRVLEAGEVVEIEGIRFRKDEGPIKPGDLYIAERNTGPKLLTCERVNDEGGWIQPTTTDYSFDIHECVKVCEADKVEAATG